MPKKHVISCWPSGSVESVQNDDFPLNEMGKSKMTRASDVVFDEEKQKWIATIREAFRHGEGPHSFENDSRSVCIEWEIEYLNNR